MNLFDLVVRVLLDSGDFDEGLDDAEQKSKSFGERVSSGLKNMSISAT